MAWLLKKWLNDHPDQHLFPQLPLIHQLQLTKLDEDQQESILAINWTINDYRCPICRARIWCAPAIDISVQAITERVCYGGEKYVDADADATEEETVRSLFVVAENM